MSKKKMSEEMLAEEMTLEEREETILEEAEEAVGAVEEPKTSGENVMYIGPTIQGLIRRSTVFEGGKLPKKVEEHIEKYPSMKLFFVSLEQAHRKIKELNKEQSALRTFYLQLLNR